MRVGLHLAVLPALLVGAPGCKPSATAKSAAVDELQGAWRAEGRPGDACPTALEFFADGTVEVSDGDCFLARADYDIDRAASTPRVKIVRQTWTEPCEFLIENACCAPS